jgi:hypothetical protein
MLLRLVVGVAFGGGRARGETVRFGSGIGAILTPLSFTTSYCAFGFVGGTTDTPLRRCVVTSGFGLIVGKRLVVDSLYTSGIGATLAFALVGGIVVPGCFATPSCGFRGGGVS